MKFAVAFSAFDDETEPILDKSYGQLIINSYEWGINSNGNAYVHYTPLDQHTCTEKELGLQGYESSDENMFYPISKNNFFEIS